jgi:uncharacterized protein
MDNQITNSIEINEASGLEKPASRVKFSYTLFLLFIYAGIVLCEYIFTYQSPAVGIGIALGMVVIVYVLLSTLNLEDRVARSAESLALIPLYILFTSSLPWYFIQQQYLIPAVYACILALCFWYIYRNNINIKALFKFNVRTMWKWTVLAFIIAIPTGALEYFILRPAAGTPAFEVPILLLNIVYMVFFVGLGEELLFRGLIQQDLTNIYGWKWGLLGTSLLFAVMHMTWRSIPELFFVFAAALLLGGLYVKTRSLAPSIVLHAVNNVILVAIWPYIWHFK